MSFLVKAVNEIIKVIQEHMQDKLSLEQDQIPDAHLTNLIAKQKLTADLLSFQKDGSKEEEEIDQLDLFLADLKLDLSKEKYLNQVLRFKDITWKELMELSFKDFGLELINNLKSESVEDRKLIIVARLRHRLYELTRQARGYLARRDAELSLVKQMEALALVEQDANEEAQLPNRKNQGGEELAQREAELTSEEEMDVHDVRHDEKQAQVEREVKEEQGHNVRALEEHSEDLDEVPVPKGKGHRREQPLVMEEEEEQRLICVDKWLYERVVAEIAQAEQLSKTAESGERALVTFNSGGGKTKPLLARCKMVVNETYELMRMFDEHDDHQFMPSSKEALRDFLPSHYRDQSPVVVAHLQGFHYVLDNLLTDADVKSKHERSFGSYLSLSGAVEYLADSYKTNTHDSALAKKKRLEVIKFFDDLTLKMDEDMGKRYTRFLSTIDTFGGASDSMTYRKHLSQQALTVYYKTLHDKLLEQAPHKVSSQHKKKCTFH